MQACVQASVRADVRLFVCVYLVVGVYHSVGLGRNERDGGKAQLALFEAGAGGGRGGDGRLAANPSLDA